MSDSCDPMDCSLPGSSVHGILQVSILEWIVMPSSRGSSQPRDRTRVSHMAGGFFTVWATRKALPTAYQGEVEKSLRAYWNVSESLCLGSKQTRGSGRWYSRSFSRLSLQLMCNWGAVRVWWSQPRGLPSTPVRADIELCQGHRLSPSAGYEMKEVLP